MDEREAVNQAEVKIINSTWPWENIPILLSHKVKQNRYVTKYADLSVLAIRKRKSGTGFFINRWTYFKKAPR